jgi:hypothetical protein
VYPPLLLMLEVRVICLLLSLLVVEPVLAGMVVLQSLLLLLVLA